MDQGIERSQTWESLTGGTGWHERVKHRVAAGMWRAGNLRDFWKGRPEETPAGTVLIPMPSMAGVWRRRLCVAPAQCNALYPMGFISFHCVAREKIVLHRPRGVVNETQISLPTGTKVAQSPSSAFFLFPQVNLSWPAAVVLVVASPLA